MGNCLSTNENRYESIKKEKLSKKVKIEMKINSK